MNKVFFFYRIPTGNSNDFLKNPKVEIRNQKKSGQTLQTLSFLKIIQISKKFLKVLFDNFHIISRSLSILQTTNDNG